jgi:8-oxo-dGTP pyrophosphatase MutT (NUDIX family)
MLKQDLLILLPKNNMASSKPIISALLIKKNENKEIELFLQTRWKPEISPNYSGMIEIPAGMIEGYENVYEALKREVKEETNLDIVKVINDYKSELRTPRPNDSAFVFKPFICQQVTETNNGLPWIGFVFLCEVKGEVKLQQSEAKDPRWVSMIELKRIIDIEPEVIFPLQLPVLEYFLKQLEQVNI